MNLDVQKITSLNNDNLNKITGWLFNWWGKIEGYSYDELKCYVLNSLQENRLPQTYAIFDNDKIIGMYQITFSDLDCRPDLYPWLANVYVDDNYRHNGIGTKLLESIKKNIENTNFDQIYLYTDLKGFYEKFGFEFISEIDTFKCKPRKQFLYKLNLK